MKRSSNSNSSNYRLGKNILQSTPITNTYNIQNTITQQIWKCKVFDLIKITQYNMIQVLQYNQEVFNFLKDKYLNSLYFDKAFQKNQQEFLVFQSWNQRLSTYIEKNHNGIKDQTQVKRILQDVIMSICDIYAEDYMILNLRPQQIVRVQLPTQGSLGWKIQSLVFEYNNYGLPQKCQYEFDYDWASNQQKQNKQNLDETLKDQQIVWYMGILALRLIYGPKFKINNKFKDYDINLKELKNLCLPQVYELIQKSVKSNQKNRISLKQFFNLSVFSQIQIDFQVKNKFITGNSQRIKKSMIMKSSILQKSINRKSTDIFKMTVSSQIHISQCNKLQIPDKIKKSTQKSGKLTVLSEIKSNKIYNQLRWMLQKCLYLAEIKDYTQTSACINEIGIEDRTVIRYLYYKIGEINLQRFKQLIQFDPVYRSFRESLNSKDLYKDLLDCIEQNAKSKDIKSIIDESVEYENKMKKLDPKQLKLLSEYDYIASNIKKNIQNKKNNIQQLAQYFATINGKFYTSLKTYIENTDKIQNKGIKIRAICYFILSSYIILSKPIIQDQSEQLTQLLNNDFKIYKHQFYDQQRLQGSIHVKFVDQIQYIRLCQFMKRAKQDVLIENCQNILKNYFKLINGNQKLSNELQKDYKRRTSLKVPGRVNY